MIPVPSRREFLAVAGGAALASLARPSHAAPEPLRLAKKGCCFVAKDGAKFSGRLEKLRPAWVYTWGASRPETLPRGIDFTPMVWGDFGPQWLDRTLADLTRRREAGEVAHVLGFNEPDQPKQSNLSVERVLELWPRLMEVGAPLVSPGCVHPDRDWMRAFMRGVEEQKLRVDAVAVHSYGGPNVEHLVQRLTKVHAEFGRPLWITEFAVGDWEATQGRKNRHSTDRVAGFLREALPALDGLDFVHRYAWFSASPGNGPLGTSALLTDAGGLTPLGKLYAEHTPALVVAERPLAAG